MAPETRISLNGAPRGGFARRGLRNEPGFGVML
jgi:hypothetical protein